MKNFRLARLPFLLAIAHGGMVVPRELAPRLALRPSDVFFDSNPWTREIFALGELVQGRLEVDVARCVIDIDCDPSLRPPAVEDGVVKSCTRYNKPVWLEQEKLTSDEVTRLIERYHKPYHEILERTASRGGVRMGIDCHSMAPVGAPGDPDPGAVRPMFCLGNMGDSNGEGEWTSCRPAVLQVFKEALEEEFQDIVMPEGVPLVTLNSPFSGGYILKRHRPDRRGWGTPWVQFTVNRNLVAHEEPQDPAETDVVPDSDREVVSKVRIRIFNALKRFAAKLPANM